MKALWKGAISFGLVNIHVELYTAAKSDDLHFHLIDKRDERKIKYKKVNEATGEEVPLESIVKAYEFDNGSYVVMTDEDFVKADVTAVKSLVIETFIQKEELSLIYLEKPYYIVPEKGAEKPYVLLRETMKNAGKIAVARVVLRNKGYLAAIYPLNDALVLNLIRFHEEIRPVEELNIPHTADISAKEMDLAGNLLDGMTEEWKPENYRDEYRDAVMKRIENKSVKTFKEADDKETYPEREPEKVIDIVDLLKRSVEKKSVAGREAGRG